MSDNSDTMAMAFSLSASAATAPVAITRSSMKGRALRPAMAPARPVALSGARRVETSAIFGGLFGGGGGGTPMVCIDCGYVYRGDFAALDRSYRCPECGVGKSRFKALTPEMQAVMSARSGGGRKPAVQSRGDAGGGWWNRESENNMTAAEKAVRDAERRKKKRDKGQREKLKAQYMEREKDTQKKKGWFS